MPALKMKQVKKKVSGKPAGKPKEFRKNEKISFKMLRKKSKKQARQEKKAIRKMHACRYSIYQQVKPEEKPVEEQPPSEAKPKMEKIKSNEKKRQLTVKKEDVESIKRKVLQKENEREDRDIVEFEKYFRINKRNKKSLPPSFLVDGLGDLLHACDPTNFSSVAEPDIYMDDSNFDDDYEIAMGQKQFFSDKRKSSTTIQKKDDATIASERQVTSDEKKAKKRVTFNLPSSVNEEDRNSTTGGDSHSDSDAQQENDSSSDEGHSDESAEDDTGTSKLTPETNQKMTVKNEKKKNKYWEDIYGRVRDNEGNVIDRKPSTPGCYVPPALREETTNDPKKAAVLQKLKRQMQGLLNRLAESNMKSISTALEELYMKNARNDMNDTLIQLMMDAIINIAPTPERLIQEHALLVALLHANIGSEIGARFLEAIADKFKALHTLGGNYGEGKQCDNLVLLLIHLYSFKIVSCMLIYDLLNLFVESFLEKDIELILLVLRGVGFTLRKHDPMMLKSTIQKLQTRASEVTGAQQKSRVRFMLDILVALRNNNMYKIPNYDPSHVQHLKKLLQSLIRKGNAVTELKISLGDLLNAESRGRWWVVGSAWTSGESIEQNDKRNAHETILPVIPNVSEKILILAHKHRMNTDSRKTVFCIIMTADDYIDAFEKLLRLKLTGHQERDIINVIIECCLREKEFNPYYSFLLQKFCNQNRKYQLMTKFAVWDKIKLLKDVPEVQSSNFARLLSHLFLTNSIAISILKVIQFSDMDRGLVRFFRQILLTILLHDPEHEVQIVFSSLLKSPKLQAFKEAIVLFMHHFMLKNKDQLPSEVHEKLELRVKFIDKFLNSYEY